MLWLWLLEYGVRVEVEVDSAASGWRDGMGVDVCAWVRQCEGARTEREKAQKSESRAGCSGEPFLGQSILERGENGRREDETRPPGNNGEKSTATPRPST
jgi:hypothetical protein